jgi:ribonuclease T1
MPATADGCGISFAQAMLMPQYLQRLGAILTTALLGCVGCADRLPEPAPTSAPEAEVRHHKSHHGHHKAHGDVDQADRNHRAEHDRPEEVPPKAITVLKEIDAHHRAPQGYEGGRHFENRDGQFPRQDENGKVIIYQEWDVNPHRPGVNRGPERLVTGSDGSARFTADHYKTFIKIR